MEPIPEHLKALTELTRQVHEGGMARYLRDYGVVVALSIAYGFIAWSSADRSTAMCFLGVLFIVFTLHGIAERRAQRRLQLLHDVLIHLQHSSLRSNTAKHGAPE